MPVNRKGSAEGWGRAVAVATNGDRDVDYGASSRRYFSRMSALGSLLIFVAVCSILTAVLAWGGGSSREVPTAVDDHDDPGPAADPAVGEATCRLRSSVMPPRPYVPSYRTPHDRR
jgi:hypothetical protein